MMEVKISILAMIAEPRCDMVPISADFAIAGV